MSQPMHIISLGAGVQSSTMALMATHGEITPMPDAAILADTQGEPATVYKWLDWLEKQLPFPVYRVTKGSLADETLRLRVSKKSGKTYNRAMIPAFVLKPDGSRGLLGRKCTIEYKIEVLTRKARELAGVPRGCKTVRIVQWIGISDDEWYRAKPARVKWIKHRFPLLEKKIDRLACLAWMKEHGLPEPPRSACTYCPFHGDAEWDRLKRDEPEEFEKVIAFEKRLQGATEKDEVLIGVPFLHESCKPIGEVVFKPVTAKGYRQLDFFGSECAGLCGV